MNPIIIILGFIWASIFVASIFVLIFVPYKTCVRCRTAVRFDKAWFRQMGPFHYSCAVSYQEEMGLQGRIHIENDPDAGSGGTSWWY